ncbi:PDR/VanB family oxidoreductase [Amphritea sp.]|uniref:PDR/VanB family oxidoreductase n=1 Tax=Amphritea sp. TaxID=1872502 RepID=UPI003A904FEA
MLQVKVAKKNKESEHIVSFDLVALDGQALPEFTAGAHIDVQTPNGPTRQYSLCSSVTERDHYRIAVILEAESRGGSAAMHSAVNEGDLLTISEPRNLFPLAEKATNSLLIAGGVGVTPMMCMADALHRQGAAFSMYYCGRNKQHMAFVDDLLSSDFADRVEIHENNGIAEKRKDMDALLSTVLADTHLYVCGPNGFMDHVLDTARKHGWPETQLHREYFTAPVTDDDSSDAFVIELVQSGKVLTVPADMSAAEVILEAGIDLSVSCEQGVCGACLTDVLEGTPDHRDSFLTDEEQQANDQFTPCCSRSRSAKLVLDL